MRKQTREKMKIIMAIFVIIIFIIGLLPTILYL
jgi:hypothetical protein